MDAGLRRAAAEFAAVDVVLIEQIAASDPRPIDPIMMEREMQKQIAAALVRFLLDFKCPLNPDSPCNAVAARGERHGFLLARSCSGQGPAQSQNRSPNLRRAARRSNLEFESCRLWLAPGTKVGLIRRVVREQVDIAGSVVVHCIGVAADHRKSSCCRTSSSH